MSPAPVRQRWALLIGISGYAHQTLRLEYAARDAQRLREVLLQPTAGSFAADRVLLLSDTQATLAGLTKALRTFLKRPAPDDLVLLFFACHGAHDPERPGNLYLLPHDTDPADISGTVLPMREVDLALKETLVSRNVVVFMDSCHSGGIGGGFRAHEAAAADFNRYMAELSDARGGVSVLTLAMANEGALEGEQWGQGHGRHIPRFGSTLPRRRALESQRCCGGHHVTDIAGRTVQDVCVRPGGSPLRHPLRQAGHLHCR